VAERKSFLLRIDPALWTEVERLAHAELRSVNAQIEYLLRDALARRRKHPRPDAPPQRARESEPD
jgi:hypothetical protein